MFVQRDADALALATWRHSELANAPCVRFAIQGNWRLRLRTPKSNRSHYFAADFSTETLPRCKPFGRFLDEGGLIKELYS